jgi:diaminopimelate epimerase
MQTGPASSLPFIKMHGLGNDFVVFDARQHAIDMTPALARAIADRQRGVGFDQIAIIRASDETDLRLDFLNADGSVSAACGNATRCVARWEMDRTGKTALSLLTGRGRLHAIDAGDGMTAVNMGHPEVDWQHIPLSEAVDTLHLPLEGDPVATGMGNPHCTFFVDDVAAVDLAAFGSVHEHHRLFPERTNVQVVQVMSPSLLRMRVWERGTGITLASGSSSCAVAVAAARRGLAGRHLTVQLDGGAIDINWRDDGVWMTGPAAHVFDGVLTPAFLASV